MAGERTLAQRLGAEAVGTAFLLAGVVGSGIMADRLTTDAGLALLQNALATAALLTALILTFQHVSGAHFNPAVTLGFRLLGNLTSREALGYVMAQIGGGIAGVVLANVMFDLDPISISETARAGAHLGLAEIVATFGLLTIIFGPVRTGDAGSVAYAVGGFIGAAYYFTSSTSFANPAVTIARTLTDTFAGIEPASVPLFLGAQVVGAVLAALFARRVLTPTAS